MLKLYRCLIFTTSRKKCQISRERITRGTVEIGDSNLVDLPVVFDMYLNYIYRLVGK